MKQKIIVLGGGLVGSAIGRNLAHDGSLDITVADIDEQNLDNLTTKYGLKGVPLDVGNTSALSKAVADFDLVIGAVPGAFGFRMLKTVIESGKNIVDISFCPEDMLPLHDLAVKKGVTAVVDAGFQPGLGNLVLGRYYEEYEQVETFICYVGGLPQVRHWPYEYQSVFSPIDVLEEYTRPARMRFDGQDIESPALSDLELIDLPRTGTLEAFNTDGLRSLLQSFPILNMVEKTLRYPGHAEKMLLFRESGFFESEPIQISGQKVAPIDLTSRLLFEMWKPEEDEHDLAVMRIIIDGLLGGRQVTTIVDLYDEHEPRTDTTAMARTTGYTCAAAARLVLDGSYSDPGIRPLEFLGARKDIYSAILKDLAGWEINLNITQSAPEENEDQ